MLNQVGRNRKYSLGQKDSKETWKSAPIQESKAYTYTERQKGSGLNKSVSK